jgi:hypothetical protein
MSFHAALTSDQLNTLRGTAANPARFSGAAYISLCPNTAAYTARVNQTIFSAALAQITYDTGSGTLANVQPGMTVLLSKSNDAKAAYWAGRVRKTPTASRLYINETSPGDIADNDYIFVLDDYRIWDRLGREVSGTLYADYDLAFQRMPPVIHNLRSAYAGWIDTTISALEIAFSAQAFAAESGASISGYSWSIADGTLQAGTLTSAAITVRFPGGFRWISLTVTDSGGRTATRRIPVWAHSSAYPPHVLSADDLNVTATAEGGYNGSLRAFAGVSAVLDSTLLVAWGDDRYQTGAGPLTGSNILLLGRLRQQNDSLRPADDAGADAELRYEVEGPLAQLGRLQQLPYEFTFASNPTKWGQVNKLTPWRACVLQLRLCSTFLDLHSLTFDSTADTFQAAGFVTQSGNILTGLNDLASSINAAVQINAAGQAQIVRDAQIINLGLRAALPTVATWGAADVLDIALEQTMPQQIGNLQASGGSYNTTSRKVTPVLSLAPGVAQGYAEGQGQLSGQVLVANEIKSAAEAELNTRSGNAYAKSQALDRLTITHPDGYYWLTPAADQWFCFDPAALPLVSGGNFTSTTRWLLVSSTVRHDAASGTKQVQVVYVRESSGPPGQTITQPPSSEGGNPPPVEFPPIEPGFGFPPEWYQPPGETGGPVVEPPNQPRSDGGTVLLGVGGTHNRVYLSTRFLAAEPTWADVTPPIAEDGLIKQAIFDPWRKSGAYVLAREEHDEWCYRFDFTLDDQGWISCDQFFINSGGDTTDTSSTYQDGIGWKGNTYYFGVGRGYTAIRLNFPYNVTLKKINITGIDSNVGNSGYMESTYFAIGGGSFTLTGTYLEVCMGNFGGGVNPTITSVTLYGQGPNPFGLNHDCTPEDYGPPIIIDSVWRTDDVFADPVMWLRGAPLVAALALIDHTPIRDALYAADTVTAASYYSTDRGVSWATAEDAGAPNTPLSGADVSKFASVLLLSGDGQMQKQATGGAFAAYGGAKEGGAVFIPRKTFTTLNTNNNGSDPQYLLAAGVSDGGESLWRVTVAGAIFTAITPTLSGNDGLGVGPQCIVMPWASGRIILAILLFGSTRRLVISTDSGATWAEATGDVPVGAVADYIRMRKTDTRMRQAYFNASNGPAYLPNVQAASPTFVIKPYPSDQPIVSIEPWEGA